MSNVRETAPLTNSLCFRLFKLHFTELNKMYWSNRPAANYVRAKASVDGSSMQMFPVQPDEESRLAPSIADWRDNYHEVQNFIRLSLLLSACSCFEIYVRSIASLALESKPGVVFSVKNAIDGAKLLKAKPEIFTFDKSHPFYKEVMSIAQGDWSKRMSNFTKYFGALQSMDKTRITAFESLQRLRNEVAHYFGRKKKEYEAPLLFTPMDSYALQHSEFISYMDLIFTTAAEIDNLLYKDYVGSYEMLKLFVSIKTSEVDGFKDKRKAKWFREQVNSHGVERLETAYYEDLIALWMAL